jgi:hypothetical protein
VQQVLVGSSSAVLMYTQSFCTKKHASPSATLQKLKAKDPVL